MLQPKTVFVSSRSLVVLASLALGALLGGCGLAETTTVAVAEAEASVEQAKQAKAIEAKVNADIAAAQQTAADARNRAEAESE